MILGVHHPALAVPDMAKALAFYRDLLGFELVMEAEIPPGFKPMNEAFAIEDASFKVSMLKKGHSRLELFEFNHAEAGDPQRPVNRLGITHFALASDNIAEDYQWLADNGVSFNAPLFGAAPSRFAYGRDPFGNVIELLEET